MWANFGRRDSARMRPICRADAAPSSRGGKALGGRLWPSLVREYRLAPRWIPETLPLFVQSDTVHGEGVVAGDAAAGAGGRPGGWDEVFRETAEGFRVGRCVVCVGTSELADAAPDAEARRLGHIEGALRGDIGGGFWGAMCVLEPMGWLCAGGWRGFD